MTPNWLRRIPLAMLLRGSAFVVILSFSAIAQVHSRSGGDTGGGGHKQGSSHGAPEIDPTVASAGIVLLIGGTLVLTGRRYLARS